MAAKVAEKKILILTSQVTERDEAIRKLKEERPTKNEVLTLISQVTKKDEEIRLLKEELDKRTKWKYMYIKYLVFSQNAFSTFTALFFLIAKHFIIIYSVCIQECN